MSERASLRRLHCVLLDKLRTSGRNQDATPDRKTDPRRATTGPTQHQGPQRQQHQRKHRRRHERGHQGTDANTTHTDAHTEAPGTPARNPKRTPERKISRWKSQTVVVDRLAASICHGRSRTDTGSLTRSYGCGPDRSAAAAIGGILLGDGRLGWVSQNLQTRTRTPSRTSPLHHAHHHVRRVNTRRRTQLSWAWRCPRKCSPCSRRQEGGSTCQAGART